MLTFILGETQDDPLRIVIDWPEFRRIPKAGHITEYRCTVRPATLCYSTTQFAIVSLCCILTFQEGFSAKQQKMRTKKKSLQRYRALTDNYMENKMFVSKNDQSK